ncbi:MAG: uridine kinase [Cryomorphaceae bacterium]|nr:uridine kinase [Cryomorphaceae bacterium]
MTAENDCFKKKSFDDQQKNELYLCAVNSQVKRPYIIGISGGSATGKTSVLNALLAQFSEDELTLVSQDNYYLPKEQQSQDENGWTNFDLPESINRAAYFSDVQQLIQGKKVEKEEYTFNNPNKAPKIITFNPSPVIITEGLFVFYYEEIRELLDYKVYLQASPDIRLERRINRDHKERGYPKHEVIYQWENHVRPADVSYLEPYRNMCNIEIDNNEDFSHGVNQLAQHIRQILNHA